GAWGRLALAVGQARPRERRDVGEVHVALDPAELDGGVAEAVGLLEHRRPLPARTAEGRERDRVALGSAGRAQEGGGGQAGADGGAERGQEGAAVEGHGAGVLLAAIIGAAESLAPAVPADPVSWDS